MPKYIINQDLDEVIKYAGNLRTKPVMCGETLWAINLLMGDRLLGTFDSTGEIIAEILRIEQSEDEYYIVRGYSPYIVDEIPDFEYALEGD